MDEAELGGNVGGKGARGGKTATQRAPERGHSAMVPETLKRPTVDAGGETGRLPYAERAARRRLLVTSRSSRLATCSASSTSAWRISDAPI